MKVYEKYIKGTYQYLSVNLWGFNWPKNDFFLGLLWRLLFKVIWYTITHSKKSLKTIE